MTPFHCSTCFAISLLFALVLWSLILVSAASRSAVHPGAPVPSWADAGGRRTGVPRGRDDERTGQPRVFVVPTPTPAVAQRPTPSGASVPAPRRGIASYMAPSYDRRYLALPGGPGIRVRVCGAAGCVVRVSTDAGPDLAMQRAGRIVDLSWWDWQTVSGLSPARGLAPVTVEVLR